MERLKGQCLDYINNGGNESALVELVGSAYRLSNKYGSLLSVKTVLSGLRNHPFSQNQKDNFFEMINALQDGLIGGRRELNGYTSKLQDYGYSP